MWIVGICNKQKLDQNILGEEGFKNSRMIIMGISN